MNVFNDFSLLDEYTSFGFLHPISAWLAHPKDFVAFIIPLSVIFFILLVFLKVQRVLHQLKMSPLKSICMEIDHILLELTNWVVLLFHIMSCIFSSFIRFKNCLQYQKDEYEEILEDNDSRELARYCSSNSVQFKDGIPFPILQVENVNSFPLLSYSIFPNNDPMVLGISVGNGIEKNCNTGNMQKGYLANDLQTCVDKPSVNSPPIQHLTDSNQQSEPSCKQSFKTSEKVSKQSFKTSEKVSKQSFKTSEKVSKQSFKTSEKVSKQSFQTSEKASKQSFKTSEKVSKQSDEFELNCIYEECDLDDDPLDVALKPEPNTKDTNNEELSRNSETIPTYPTIIENQCEVVNQISEEQLFRYHHIQLALRLLLDNYKTDRFLSSISDMDSSFTGVAGRKRNKSGFRNSTSWSTPPVTPILKVPSNTPTSAGSPLLFDWENTIDEPNLCSIASSLDEDITERRSVDVESFDRVVGSPKAQSPLVLISKNSKVESQSSVPEPTDELNYGVYNHWTSGMDSTRLIEDINSGQD